MVRTLSPAIYVSNPSSGLEEWCESRHAPCESSSFQDTIPLQDSVGLQQSGLQPLGQSEGAIKTAADQRTDP